MRAPILILLSVFLFFFNFSFSQTSNPPPEINGQYVTVPPSPTSFEFTKYGNIPVNEFSGSISPTIPLFEYKANRLSLPISMNYSGNGVKVAQQSSWTGINWNLVAGGMITRTINDLPDEHSSSVHYSPTNIPPDNLLGDLANPGYQHDTQQDKFTFRFLNYSGIFYLDENDQFQLGTYEYELEISTPGGSFASGSNIITITTPDGTIYTFGGIGINGIEYTEKTDVIPTMGGGGVPQYNTSYYLASIQNQFGDVINFEYGTETVYDVRLSQTQRMTYVQPVTQATNWLTPGYYGPTLQNMTLRVENGLYLKKITSNRTDVVVEFTSNHSGQTSPYDYKRVLDKIEIYNYPNTIYTQTIDLKYDNFEANIQIHPSRFFLTDIKRDGGNVEMGDYRFEYYEQYLDDFPDRFGYAQDYLGYYNGKDNNTTLLTWTSTFDGAPISFADRSPSFAHAVTGALEKIIYPTGGHTLFEYETNPKSVPLPPKNVRLEVHNNKQAFGQPGTPYTSPQLTAGGAIGVCLVAPSS